jgi:hypothetical protein
MTLLRDRLRTYLRNHPDGATPTQLGADLSCTPEAVRRALASMPDAYIRTWVQHPKFDGQLDKHTPVWCVVPVPPNAPRP